MTPIEWKISGQRATVDPARPSRGIRYEDTHLLGVCVPEFTESTKSAIVEQFKQEDRLTVRYAGTAAWPVWTEVTWQVYENRDRPGLNIDLNVSVRTDRLHYRPELIVQSVVPQSKSFLVQGTQNRLIQLASGSPYAMTRVDAAGCVLFRPSSQPWSLVEMVHPFDFEHDELSHDPEHPDHLRLSHRLFTQPLEKGVLLRARLRAIVIDRDDDLETAALRYAEFNDEPPVL